MVKMNSAVGMGIIFLSNKNALDYTFSQKRTILREDKPNFLFGGNLLVKSM